MKSLLIILITLITLSSNAQEKSNFRKGLKKTFKFATFYGAINGKNSMSDVDVFSVTNGLETGVVKTPFDYSLTVGLRKIARLGYEYKARGFYNGTENSFSDAATIGKLKGFEFLFEVDYSRQQGTVFLNQHHFLRYVANNWIAKIEYLQDGFADIKYFEASQRYRQRLGKRNKLSLNVGTVQRLSEPYGYNPLEEWMLSNGNLHYTDLALREGYTVNFNGPGDIVYLNPNGEEVASSTEVWEAVVIPKVLADYATRKKLEMSPKLEYSFVLGFDLYHYTKTFWIHTWGNIMPYHINTGDEFSYHNFIEGQWIDYSGGLIFGYKFNKSLGVFLEGKYNKYWNRNWHNFSVGVNYVIF